MSKNKTIRSAMRKKAKKLKKQASNASRPVQQAPVRKQKKNKKRGKKKSKSSVPRGVSMVSDGVNVGSVWKNTTPIENRQGFHREKVTDLVSTSTAFALIKQYYLNPGNSVLFPVTSIRAATYEQYRCHHLRFIFRTEEYMASGSNVSAGIVCYSTNMDPDDSSFSGLDQMENYDGSISGAPFSGIMVHDVAGVHKQRGRNRSKGDDMSLNNYYIYSSANQAAPSGQAAKFYDLGNFQVACNGAQAGTMGELWVEHDFTFIRTKQQTPLGQNLLASRYYSTTGLAAGATMGTSQTQIAGSNIAVTFTGNTAVIPVVGRYLVAWGANGTTLVISSNLTASTNCTAVTGTGMAGAYGGVNGGSTTACNWAVYDITAVGGIITLPVITLATFTNATFYISQVPSGLSLVESMDQAKVEFKTSGDSEKLERMFELLMSQQSTISRLENILANRSLLSESDFEEEKETAISDSSSTSDRRKVPFGKRGSKTTGELQLPGDGSASSTKSWFRG